MWTCDGPILPLDQCNEDPVGWQDSRGTVHLLAHSMSPQNGDPGYPQQVGHRAFSTDSGLSWQAVDSTPAAYTTWLEWADGSSTTAWTRERPQVLLQTSDNGTEPTHLVTGVVAGSGTVAQASLCEGHANGYSWTHIAPISARSQHPVASTTLAAS